MTDTVQESTSANDDSVSSSLRRLSLSKSSLRESLSPFYRHPRLKLLEQLHLIGLSGYNDAFLEDLIKTLPKLNSFDLSESDIDGVGVKLAVKSGHVKELILNQCQRLGRDAVEWARDQGVRVESRIVEGVGSQRVRY